MQRKKLLFRLNFLLILSIMLSGIIVLNSFAATSGKFSDTISSTPVTSMRTTGINTMNSEYNTMSLAEKLISTDYLNNRYMLAMVAATGGHLANQPNAAKMLNHFLSNKGTDYTVNFLDMNNNWTYANSNRITQVNEALAASEVLVTAYASPKLLVNTLEYQNGSPSGAADWRNSVGKYYSSIKCSATRTSTTQYYSTITYYMYDLYDWDKTITSMGYLPVSPYDMWQLHYAGRARGYKVNGTNTMSVRWTKGQRYSTGATITQLN